MARRSLPGGVPQTAHHPRPFDHERLVAYQLALEWLRSAEQHARRILGGRGPLADHLRRASASITLNIAEAVGRRGAARAQHDAISKGSTAESAAALDVAAAWGCAKGADASKTMLSRLAAMLEALRREAEGGRA